MPQVRRLPQLVAFSASLLLGTATPAPAEEVPWRYDYNAARKEAKEKNKPIVLDFGTANCHWCKQLDVTTFRDPAVIKVLTERFIAVKIDAGKEPDLALALGINSYPTLVFAAPNGKILGQQDGYIEAAGFRRQLDRLFGSGDRSDSKSSETNVQAGDRPRRALETKAKEENEPERLAQVCEKLIDSLGNAYLDLAESLLRKGQAEQALSYLERTVRTCPGTQAAQLAQERIFLVREQLTKQPDAKGVIRTQMP